MSATAFFPVMNTGVWYNIDHGLQYLLLLARLRLALAAMSSGVSSSGRISSGKPNATRYRPSSSNNASEIGTSRRVLRLPCTNYRCPPRERRRVLLSTAVASKVLSPVR
jgi:hypothetical protein